MKKIFIMFILGFSLINMFAQDNAEKISSEAKIDSIYVMQKVIYKEQKANEPLQNKKYGVELNFFRLIAYSKVNTFSGSFSLFNIDRTAELCFPIYYINNNDFDENNNYETNQKFSEFTIDAHYRKFLGEHQKGFYLSAFTRFAHLNGSKMIIESEPEYSTYKNGTENKLGIGVGIGYRIFSYKGFYWGTSFSMGKYIIGENDVFLNSIDLSFYDDNQFIYDFEFFKFGYAF